MRQYVQNLPGAAPTAASPRRSLDARSAVRALLAAVAAFGNEHAHAARAAYEAGLAAVGWRAENDAPAFDPPQTQRNLERLDAALAALVSIRPRDKERVLRGVLAAIRADAVTATPERELFRVIAGTLDCPLPPDVVV